MDIVSVVPVVNVARLHTNIIDFIVAVVVVVVVVVSRQAITKETISRRFSPFLVPTAIMCTMTHSSARITV